MPSASPDPRTPRVIIVMPAYNAARTLERTYADIPHELVERIILVDDVSRDETVGIARQLGLDVIIHSQNRGYGGIPRWKYVSNRFLTGVENIAFGLPLSEYHTGLRAYSRRLLETVPYQLNSDDFVFDQELIAQVVAAGMAARIGEVGVPTRYFEEASSVGLRRSIVYGLSTLRVVARYLLHRLRVRRSPKLTARRP